MLTQFLQRVDKPGGRDTQLLSPETQQQLFKIGLLLNTQRFSLCRFQQLP